MNALDVQARLQNVIEAPVEWTTSDHDGHIYIGSADNVDAVIVVGPFPADPAVQVDAVDVGLNGAENQGRCGDIDAIVAAVKRLSSATQ